MENDHALETFTSHFAHDVSVRNVYGEPIVTQGKTIIPVARLAMGFGHGEGKKNGKDQDKQQPRQEGSGAGGGMYATATGVYEVTPKGTHYVPANAIKKLLIAGAIGFVLGRFFGKKRIVVKQKTV